YHAAVTRPPAAATAPASGLAAPRPAEAPRRPDGRAAAPAGGTRPPDRARRRARVGPAVRELRRGLDGLEGAIRATRAPLEDLGRTLADPTLYADGERARAVALERQQAEEQVA